jgi:hypothetical protein
VQSCLRVLPSKIRVRRLPSGCGVRSGAYNDALAYVTCSRHLYSGDCRRMATSSSSLRAQRLSPDRIFSKRGTGRLACADNCQDYICSRVALTRPHATILSHTFSFVHVPFLDSALVARYHAFFFDVKWLATGLFYS